jgi:formate dehydrogenase subunit gamma
MTPTPGSNSPRTESRQLVVRFSGTERTLHWANAAGFFACLATGLALYLPSLSAAIGRRVLVQRIHFWCGLGWCAAIVLVVVVGDHGRLLRTAREIDLFDGDDRRWLRRRHPARSGRFNAGQKINAAANVGFVVLFLASGLLLWFGERATQLRLPSTIVLHDALTFASVLLVIGHIYLAVIHPPTRHSLRGITLGTVRADWAATHHPRWRPSSPSEVPSPSATDQCRDVGTQTES